MGSRAGRKDPATEPGARCPSRAGLGFLTIAVGFLTVPAHSAPVEDELARLDRLEAQRAVVIAQADSIGRLLAVGEGIRDPRASDWLKSAEGLADRSLEMELEILLARERCRSLALQELGAIDRNDSSAVARVAELGRLLDDRLARGFGGIWVVVEPDSADGVETLLDKQAYLEDLRDRLGDVRERVDRRRTQVRRERALLRANEGLADESRFLDEGGRVGSDETVLLHGWPGTPPGEGAARLPGTTGGIDAVEFPDRSGDGESGSGDVDAALEKIRSRVDRDLERVDASLETIGDLLRRSGATGS